MTSNITFDAELLQRYDQPGPRYTSYPTAPAFAAGFGAAQLRDQARRTNQEPIPRDTSRSAPYLQRLAREIELIAPWFDRDREVVQVHLGGGTPNFLRPEQIFDLMESLHSHFHLTTSARRDFSIELDPRFLNTG